MDTIDNLTEKIEALKLELDNHAKNSREYLDIKAQRETLMKERVKLRNRVKKGSLDTLSVTSNTSNRSLKSNNKSDLSSLAKPTKKVTLITPQPEEVVLEDDEYLDTMRYLAEQEEIMLKTIPVKPDSEMVDITPGSDSSVKVQCKEQGKEQGNELDKQQDILQQTQDNLQKDMAPLIQEFKNDMKNLFSTNNQAKPEVTFINNPQNDAIRNQFQGQLTKQQIIMDIHKLQAVMGIHASEDLNDKSYEDCFQMLKDIGVKFRTKKHNISELLANMHVVGYAALLNLANPITEEQAGFTFANAKEHADEAKPMLAQCYDELIAEDPYLGKYLMASTSGGIGLLTVSASIAAKSFSMDEKKFVTTKQKN